MNGGAPCPVLIVDDDEGLGKTLLAILIKRGYDASWVRTGKEAVCRVQEAVSAEPVRIALIDLRLPDGDGLAFLGKMREIEREMDAVITTGYADAQNAIGALNQGAFAFLQKPYNPDAVMAILARMVERRELKRQNQELLRQLKSVNENLENRVAERTFELESTNRELARKREELRSVFGEMREAAVLIDASGGVLLSNGSAEKLLGLAPTDDRPFVDQLASLEMRPPMREIFASEKRIVEFDVFRDVGDGTILSGSASSVQIEGDGEHSSRGWLFVCRDVTEERREQALKRSFLLLLSHKLKTPLTAILGYSQLVRQSIEGPLPEKQTRFLETISREAAKLSEWSTKLIRFGLLQKSGTSALQRSELDVDEALSRAVGSLDDWLKDNGASVELGKPCGERIFADPELVQDMLRELIENGAKFNKGRDRRVHLSAEASGNQVLISIRDHGPGIAPREQEKILSLFYQSEEHFTGQVVGFGVGLAFAREVVRRHGGVLLIESQVGEGTTVRLTIPKPV